MAQRLTGKQVTAALAEEITTAVENLGGKGIKPTLALVRIGENPDDISYERTAIKRAETLGIAVSQVLLPAESSQTDVEDVIEAINNDEAIHGCLMFRPLPKHLDEQAICDLLASEKDIDGISSRSLASVFMDAASGYPPCTAAACLEMLDFYDISLEGKEVVVIGRSLVIGKPVAMMLLKRNASVTICHSRTADLSEVTKRADIVICATGRARAYGAEFFSEGQVVLDVGINFDDGGNLCGDADFDQVEQVVKAITPVPGGIGGVTTQLLMKHVVEAAACQ